MSAPETWEWCGHAHHFIAADSCRFHMATWVAGGRYLVSTVGDYHPGGQSEPKQIGAGAESLFETYVFATDPDNREKQTGHPVVTDWAEVTGERCATAEQANEMHLRYCREFEERAS